jgi:hypothetical protein
MNFHNVPLGPESLDQEFRSIYMFTWMNREERRNF